MTKIQPAVLWTKWNEQGQPPRCEHLNVKMEDSATAYMLSTYHCLACGETMAR